MSKETNGVFNIDVNTPKSSYALDSIVDHSGTIDLGSLNYTGSWAQTFAQSPYVPTSSLTSDAVRFNRTVAIDESADITIGNRSLKTFMEKVEQRLAILQPDPVLLEKYQALQQAYEHYKTLEALCTGQPPQDPDHG